MTASSTSDANAPSQNDALATLLHEIRDQLTNLHLRMDRLEALAAEGRSMGGAAIEVLDAHAAEWQKQGIDIEERAQLLREIAESLTQPSILRNVLALTQQTSQVNKLLQTFNELPGVAATIIDIFDSMMDQATERGLDIDARLRALATAGEHLSSSAAIATLEALFGEESTESASQERLKNPILQLFIDTSSALREAIDQPPQRAGLFRMLRAGRDKDVQTLTAFSLRLAKSLGKRLHPTDNTAQITHRTPAKTLSE